MVPVNSIDFTASLSVVHKYARNQLWTAKNMEWQAERTFDDDARHMHWPSLTNPVGAVNSLLLYGRIPPEPIHPRHTQRFELNISDRTFCIEMGAAEEGLEGWGGCGGRGR